MKTVLCDRDNFRQELCFECRKKLEQNHFTKADVSVSQALGKVSKNFPIVNVNFHKALDLDEYLVLVCSGQIGSLIGKNGKIAFELSKNLGKKIRIVEKTKNEKKMIQDMLGNARIIGIEKIFDPGFSETKIHVQKQDRQKLSEIKEKIEKSLESLLGMKTTIEFC